MTDAVIVAGVRTPVGSFGGTLKSTPVVDLGALVLKETLKRAGLKPVATEELTRFAPDPFKGRGMIDLEKKAYDYADSLKPIRIDEVIMGNVVGAGQGQNVARQAMIKAGIPKETNAFTINKVCASGMKAVALAAQSIKAGDAEIVLTGEGDKAFIAGADISYMVSLPPLGARKWSEQGHDLGFRIENFPLPVIACVNGFALGGGAEMAMACDAKASLSSMVPKSFMVSFSLCRIFRTAGMGPRPMNAGSTPPVA